MECAYQTMKKLILAGTLCLMAFTRSGSYSLQWSQAFLSARYDAAAEVQKVKKYDFQLTPDGFFRLKKTFVSGKQEYFAFHLSRLSTVDFSGNTEAGVLVLKTRQNDIIVQTFNDRRGNIDTMSSLLPIPLKHIEAETLDSLARSLKLP